MDPISLEDALEKKGNNHWWLLWILFLTSSPSIFNASHLASYIFLGGDPSFFCNVPELVEANWTKEQIRKISSPGLGKQSCVLYTWDYSFLKDLDFEDALNYTNAREKPSIEKCKSYIYDEKLVHQTIVSEWDLVCEDSALISTAQGSVAVGKFFGALTFGLISDRFGRKKTFIFSSILMMIAGPSAAFANSFVMFIIFRLLIGVAGAGVYETGYTILMEITVKNHRAYLGNIFNIPYSFGLVYLPLAAYLTTDWRQLQLALSLPLFALIIHCWYLPESPRWLITMGKLEKASTIIGHMNCLESNVPHQSSYSDSKNHPECFWKNVFFFLKNYLKLFSTVELAKRTLICNYLWLIGYLYYYIIALNGSNFEVEEHLYMGLNGIVDMPGFLLPILFLTHFGRKSSGIALYTIAGIAMVLLTVLPQGWPMVCMALVGRLLGTAAYGIVMFYSLELFPTESRNTAMGSFLTMSQFGPLLAPYIVEILGQKFWWLPTVLCGSLALLGAFLLIFVPETKGTPMLNTLKEMKKQKIIASINIEKAN